MPGKRIAREKLTIKKMIALYESQCPQASAVQGHYDALFAYAQKRLDKCVFGEEKPACKQCPVHCYQPAKREEMKQIMRWAGPRMLWRHPVLTGSDPATRYANASLSIPNRFIRDSRVVRLSPRRCAAPFGPATTPLVSFSTRIIS